MKLSGRPSTPWVIAGAAVGIFLAIVAGGALALTHITATPSLAQDSPGASATARVHALGRLEPAGRIRRVAPPSGSETALVARLLVDEGRDVQTGELLAMLDNHDRREAAVAEAEAHLQEARSRLEQVRAGAKSGEIEAQRQAVNLAEMEQAYVQRELDRAEQLHLRNLMSDEEHEKKRCLRDRLAIERQRAEQQLAALEEVRAVDVEVAERQVKSAEAALVRARAELRAAELRAPADGRILKIHARAGERVGEQGLLELGDVANMQAVAEIFEGDLPLVQVGQPARVILDSSGESIRGEVAELGHLVARKSVLNNDPVSDTDARVVEVRVRLFPAANSRHAAFPTREVEVTIEAVAAVAAAESVPQGTPRR
ncbi:MAG: HlyD family efflux transporter periplasmic adaptor subunit [Planctomycetota bacterium]